MSKLELPLTSLLSALQAVPDHRDNRGKKHQLASVLALAVAAVLCGAKSLYAIAQFGRDLDLDLQHALGFRKHKPPSVATIFRIFRDLDHAALESTLARWFAQLELAAGEGIAIDGKELRGSGPPHAGRTYLLAAYAQQSGYVLGQLAIGGRENEISAAPALLARLNLRGQVVTGDAMFAQTKLCAQIVAQGGDYLFVVKDNQPTLASDIQTLFLSQLALRK